MARKLSTDLIAAIESLAQADKDRTARSIIEELRAGKVPGIPAESVPDDLKLRIVQYHCKRARELLEPEPADPLEAIEALERSMRQLVRRDVRRLRAQKILSVPDARLLREHYRTLDGMRGSIERHRNPKSKGAQKAKAGQEARPAGIIEKIGREVASRDAEPVADGQRSSRGEGVADVDTAEHVDTAADASPVPHSHEHAAPAAA